jgi:hypothetical protein
MVAYAQNVPERSGAPSAFVGHSFSVLALSRGGGVPESAWQAFVRVREMLAYQRSRGIEVRMSETRIGLEGERRLCAEFAEPKAAREAWNQANAIVGGLDLIRLEARPCDH